MTTADIIPDDPEVIPLLRYVSAWILAGALVSLPFVRWAADRWRNRGRIAGALRLTAEGAAYRESTVHTSSLAPRPGVVYVALLVASMGAVFVAGSAILVMQSGDGLSSLVTRGCHRALALIGTMLARLALLDAAIAIARRAPHASRHVAFAMAFTAITLTVYIAWCAVPPYVSRETRAYYWLDCGLYAGGIALTNALVAVAWHATMAERDR